MGSDHTLVLVQFSLRLNGYERIPQSRLATGCVFDSAFRIIYEETSSDELRTLAGSSVEEGWDQIKEARLFAPGLSVLLALTSIKETETRKISPSEGAKNHSLLTISIRIR